MGSAYQALDPIQDVHKFRAFERRTLKRNRFPLSLSRTATYLHELSTIYNLLMSRVLKMQCQSSTTFNTSHNSRIHYASKHYISIRCAIRAEVRIQRCNSFMRPNQCHLQLQHHLIVILTAYLMMNQESPKQEAINCDQRSSLLIRDNAIHKSILSMVMEMQVVM